MVSMLAQLTRRKDTTMARAVAPLTIRPAVPADADALERLAQPHSTPAPPAAPAAADALERLAQLDSSRAPRGDVLVAEVGDEMWAALSLDDSHAVADPLRPSADAVWVLAERSRQLHRARRARTARRPLRLARA